MPRTTTLTLLISLPLLGLGCSSTPDQEPTTKGDPPDMAVTGDMDRADASGNNTTVDAGPDLPSTEDAAADLRQDMSNPRGRITQVELGTNFGCLIDVDGAVFCWGSHGWGESLLEEDNAVNIGDEPGERPVAIPLPRPATALAIHSDAACALLDDRSLRCWGNGAWGALGQGDTEDVGDDPGEMPVAIELGAEILAVDGGLHHFCALTDQNDVRCWGANFGGQLGPDSEKGENLGDDPGELPPPPVTIPDKTIAAIDAGASYSCAQTTDGELHCWGAPRHLDNADDQTPQPIKLDLGGAVTHLALGVELGCAVVNDETVHCWGINFHGVLGPGGRAADIGDDPGEFPPPAIPLREAKIAEIDAKANSICLRTQSDQVRCWGAVAKLGQGSLEALGDDPGELPPPDIELGARTPTQLAVGANHFCALTDDQHLLCWGTNNQGQLGRGDTETIGDDPGEMPPEPLPFP